MKLAVLESFNLPSILVHEAHKLGLKVDSICGKPDSLRFNRQLSRPISGFNRIQTQEPWTVKSLCKILREGGPYQGLISVNELDIDIAAKAAENCGIKFTRSAAVSICKNKYVSRKLLIDHKLSSCKNTILDIHDPEFIEIIDEFGYPAVLKPTYGAASQDVHILKSCNDAFNIQKKLNEKSSALQFTLETFLKGPLISVELAASESHQRVLTIGLRSRANTDQTIEIGTILPAPIPDQLWIQCENLAKEAAGMLGLFPGIFHIEMILTESGPEIVEINPRLMGGSLPKLFSDTYGENVYQLLLRSILYDDIGRSSLKPNFYGASCLFGSTQSGRLPSNLCFPWIRQYKSYGLKLDWFVNPCGYFKKLRGNLDYIGKFTWRMENWRDCDQIRETILDQLSTTLKINLLHAEKVSECVP